MKKSLIYTSILVMVIGLMACANADEPEMELEKSSIEQYLAVQVEEGKDTAPILSFDSYDVYRRTLDKLRSMDTDEARSEWMHATYPEFTSIEDIYQKAGEELAKIELETVESFNEFRHKYASLYFPMVDEDAGFYIPITDDVASFLANRDCKIIISNKEISLKDIYNYVDLQQTGRAYYDIEKTMNSKSEITFNVGNPSLDPIGPQYDSGWNQYGKRKVKLKARRRFTEYKVSPNFYGSHSWLHTEFCFRKKTIIGWINYSCKSTIAGTIAVPGRPVYSFSISHSQVSSHDDDHPLPIHISSDNTHWYYRYYETSFQATIDFKDINTALVYSWTLPALVAETPISSSHLPITPFYY